MDHATTGQSGLVHPETGRTAARFAVVATQRKSARALFFFARDVISQARADVARFSDKESFMAAKKKAAKKAKKKL